MTSEFLPLKGHDRVYVARLGKLSCTALRLKDGSLCLYSPVAGLEKTLRAQIDVLGPVSALFAPNHYHNKGLTAHFEAFANASLYCSAKAAPRLSKITGLKFDPLESLRGMLHNDQSLHEPDGMKTGEVWVQVNSGSDCALAVTDAFSSATHPPGKFGDQVSMLGTFPRYGVQDGDVYKAWSTNFLRLTSPTTLLPCHGSPVRSPDLAAQLRTQIDGAL
ncbi:MAG: hypothetical protein AAF408_14295 [Pseudomonadota bacterium]